jgi:hypothetical protein
MKRIAIAVMVVAAVAMSATFAFGQAGNCTDMEENNRGNTNWGINVNSFVLEQSFKPSRSFTLCGASVNLWCNNACTVTLQIQAALGGGALTSSTVVTIPTTTQWYYFDFPDIAVTKDVTYYIRVLTNPACNSVLWRGQSGNGQYARGQVHINGAGSANSDFLFITYALDDPPGPYWARNNGPIQINADGPITASSSRSMTATAGSITLSKDIDTEIVALNLASCDVSVGPAVITEGTPHSDFTIDNISGQFAAYSFAGEAVGVSQFGGGGGGGSINWNTNELNYTVDVEVTAFPFVKIYATVYGSGKLVGGSGGTQVQLYEDGVAVQFDSGSIPTLTGYGLLLLVVLLLLAGSYFWWRKRKAAARA